MNSTDIPTVQPGEPAPDFDLPLVGDAGRARLADYRGRAPLLLVLLRSFECPFCRRNLTSLKQTAQALGAQGMDTLAVTTTSLGPAGLYAKYRAPGLPLASDPALGIHRSYGVPLYSYVEDQPTDWPRHVNMADVIELKLNPTPELPESLPIGEAVARLLAEDDFPIDEAPGEGPPDDVSPLVSYFMLDRGGTVRWVKVIAFDDPRDYASHPSHFDLLAAAGQVVNQVN